MFENCTSFHLENELLNRNHTCSSGRIPHGRVDDYLDKQCQNPTFFENENPSLVHRSQTVKRTEPRERVKFELFGELPSKFLALS